MIGLMEPDDSAVAAQLTAVSAALRVKLPELCQAVTDSILGQIEPLSQDQAIIDLLTVSVESNVTTLVHILGYQIDSHQAGAPPAAIAYARRLAQRGVPVGDLLRAYRVGQADRLPRIRARPAGHADTRRRPGPPDLDHPPRPVPRRHLPGRRQPRNCPRRGRPQRDPRRGRARYRARRGRPGLGS